MNIFRTAILLLAMTILFMAVGWLIGGSGGAIIALIAAVGTNIFAYWNSDKIVLRMQKARQITRDNAPELFEVVADLAQNASLPMPKLYVMENDQPNAFATGRNPENSAIAVTTGILRRLNREELAGVVAHELAHIKNRDTLTMTVAATLAGAVSMMSQYWLFFGGGRSSERSPFGPLGMILAAFLAPAAALVIRSAISRTREYSADRLGAEISGNPLALAGALKKIAAYAEQKKGRSRMNRQPATAHMFIINPLNNEKLMSLFSTHPPVEKRIRELEEIAREMRIAETSRQTTIPSVPRNGGRV